MLEVSRYAPAMATAMDSMQLPQAGDATRQPVQPEVQKYLEAVFAVAPFPEEYVRYRLHLATALPLPLIDSWFEERRQVLQRSGDVAERSAAADDPEQRRSDGQQTSYPLFGNTQSAGELQQQVGAQGTAEEMANVGRTLAMMASNSGAAPDQAPLQNGHGASHRRPPRPGSGREDPAALAARFGEADLDAITSLVGLQTITSTQELCGSRSLYMFEQLTALDSLDLDSSGASKRRRTRHQHFWRNTDKLDPDERVYVPTSSIKPALKRREPVLPKREIGPEERTNAWTVCLTTRGVVSYLNKRISPLGVRMIRALQERGGAALAGHSQAATSEPAWAGDEHAAGPASSSPEGGSHDAPLRTKRARAARQGGEDVSWDPREDPAYQPHAGARSDSAGSEDDEAARSSGDGRQAQTGEAGSAGASGADFEPIPRARKRKPG